jgi:hypothetical protein
VCSAIYITCLALVGQSVGRSGRLTISGSVVQPASQSVSQSVSQKDSWIDDMQKQVRKSHKNNDLYHV